MDPKKWMTIAGCSTAGSLILLEDGKSGRDGWPGKNGEPGKPGITGKPGRNASSGWP